ncbi:valyl-tRNA synthetase [Palleronia aestuarii]|uniref:Valine--tRNA ligase n=1 Tax=Palleronia aestuarii TaxID=568105 RepID=A0A2W7N7C9_9RHOB|nr:valine--tRNA ligase [Palleronia aestuarii]PZX15980.1 valyl-tRNA synthetase [Palleronia aestuarii]
MPMEKTFQFTEAEPRLYASWEEAGCFRAGAGAAAGAETFSIMIPPPNVTGALHMGHAFNNTLQDILVRWHRMRGHDTLWQPGTDHAGIATQMVTERELAKDPSNPTRAEMGREAFLGHVWEQKRRSRGNIIGQLKRLGASCDWSREAFTMSGAPGAPEGEEGNFHDAVIKVFVEMYEKGLIYRGKRLVNWDPHFETAISDLEVENVEVPGAMWHFRYPLAGGASYTYVEKDADGNTLFEEERDWISIATTRPETMLGDGAVAVHPSDTRYAPLVGQLCEIPVGPKEHRRLIPIITDEYPDPDFGSGAVKITGAHDFNDYAVAKRGNIPCYRLMDTKGALRADGAPYAEEAEKARAFVEGADWTEAEIDAINLVPDAYRGLDRMAARDRIVADITAEGLAVMVPATDPRLGQAPGQARGASGKSASNAAPAPEPGPLAPEEGGEARTEPDALVPLVERKPIVQPFGDRSKVVIEPMLTDQWFVDAEKIVGPALDAVRNGQTRILPERDAKVYFHWLENIEPWCISRQLWWGHRVPVWYGPYLREDGTRPHAAHEITAPVDAGVMMQGGQWTIAFCGESAEAVREEAEAWYRARMGSRVTVRFAEEDADAVPPHAEEPGAEIVTLRQDEDVLDTWFSSGLWPLGTLGWPEETDELKRYFPTSTLVTGFDIIFFWVARMMMMQTAVLADEKPDLADRVPFRDVYVHALVRDAKGKKMSKSLGNVMDPLDLIDAYGADAVRFTLAAMAAMGRDLKLSEERIAGYRNFGTKLWNAFRFAEMNGALAPGARAVHDVQTSGARGTHDVGTTDARGSDVPCTGAARPVHASQTVNLWIMGEVARTREEVDAALAGYRFNDAATALYGFVWGRVCDWYLELSKPLFASEDTEIVEETRATMAWVLDQCLILLHPIMPFVTEELWQGEGKLMLAPWPEYQAADLVDEKADAEMSWVISLIEAIRSVRGEMNVPAGLQVPLLQLDLDEAGHAAWEKNAALIQRLARIESLREVTEPPKGALTVSVPGGTFALPLADIIDVEAEKARLAKALAKLEKDLAGLNGRLKNPKFLASAPEEVVTETQELMAEKTEEKERLEAALARLEEL